MSTAAETFTKGTPEQQRQTLESYFAEHMDSLAYPLLAELYFDAGELDRARRVCEIGLQHHPEHVPGLFLTARLLIREGQLNEAGEWLERTLAQDPYHVEAAELLVGIRERLKEPQPILEATYAQLLKANPLSRGAQQRLRKITAEKELLRDVRRKLRGEDSETPDPSGSGNGQHAGTAGLEITALPPQPEAQPLPPILPAAEPPQASIKPEQGEPTDAETLWGDHIRQVAATIAAEAAAQAPDDPMQDDTGGEHHLTDERIDSLAQIAENHLDADIAAESPGHAPVDVPTDFTPIEEQPETSADREQTGVPESDGWPPEEGLAESPAGGEPAEAFDFDTLRERLDKIETTLEAAESGETELSDELGDFTSRLAALEASLTAENGTELATELISLASRMELLETAQSGDVES